MHAPHLRRTAPIVSAGLFERMRQHQQQQKQQQQQQDQQPAGSSFVAAAPPAPPPPVPAAAGPAAPDYRAAATDCAVLKLPPKTELTPEEITDVFGYRRDFAEAYEMGEVLGAGSFGVVRACRRRDGKGPAAAVKTISKVPRRGAATPRHLLKLRSEADVMRQLGPSLDAVSLFEAFEDDACLHLVTVRERGGGGEGERETERGRQREGDFSRAKGENSHLFSPLDSPLKKKKKNENRSYAPAAPSSKRPAGAPSPRPGSPTSRGPSCGSWRSATPRGSSSGTSR